MISATADRTGDGSKPRPTHPIYYQDEARFGQHGATIRVWARVGTRPRVVRQTQYDSLHVYTATCAQTGDACGLITPKVNTDTMNVFLARSDVKLGSRGTRLSRNAAQAAARVRDKYPV